MGSNTHSTGHPDRQSVGQPAGGWARLPDGLAALAVVVDQLATQDRDGLADHVLAERVLVLRRLLDRLEGHWLAELAEVDARGAAGADQDVRFGSTASWLRRRLRMGASAAHTSVRTARALFRGPLTRTAQALREGELSVAHASVLAAGTHDLPSHTAVEAEPVLVEAARRLDPPRLRRLVTHLRLVADPDSERDRAQRRHEQRGLWLSPTLDNMIAVDGLLEAEVGQTLLAALEPLARPHSADDDRSGGQRRADALAELARRQLEGGRLPQTGGVRPQLTVLVDLDSLQGGPGSLGGDTELGPLDAETCRRLACDGAVTRVLVTRHPTGHHGHHDDPCGDHRHHHHPHRQATLADRLRAAARRLPPVLGGAPSQPLDVGRTTRVVQPAQRTALAVRDGGCVFPACDRPLAWCEAHHLVHWLDGGPTDLDNLVLVCRAHHRAVHEGGWQLQRQPDGRLTATPPHPIDPTEDTTPQHDQRARGLLPPSPGPSWGRCWKGTRVDCCSPMRHA
jgi:Domain of unknown function (DUF222)/HNH endonuclease